MNAPVRCALWTLAALALAGFLLPRPIQAVGPESREVRRVIDKGFRYLDANTDGRLGGKCLIALCYLKDGKDESHPRVTEAVAACKAATTPDAKAINADIYSTGIAAIFLCSLNPSKYSAQIIKLRDSLEYRQKSHGGWGYPDKPTGDTSMTQYGVLAYWEMTSAGIPTSLQSTEKVANWLLLTQSPDGGWGYQGKEGALDGSKLLLEKQDSVRPGMACAGLGATYMTADMLGLTEVKALQDANLPAALRPARDAQKVLTNKVDPRHMRTAQAHGREWIKKNYVIDPPGFTHYYLYALERYQSFLEAAEGRNVKDPTWYNDGFAYLRKTQKADGSWEGASEGMEAVNTAFGILFLLRSTKKAIDRSKSYGDGAMLAGRGVPAGANDVRIRGGQIVPKQVSATTEELLETLARPDSPNFTAVAADFDLLKQRLLASDAKERGENLAKLRALIATGVPEARLVSVKLLSQLRDLDSVPALILALDDPDWQVAVVADEGLQFIGRKISPGLGEKPDATTRAAAIQRWKTWYLTIRPDAEFD